MQPDNLAARELASARSLAAQGRHEEALTKYVWFHEHALSYNEAFAGVRLSFALGEWIELGEKYPPARQALLAARDKALAAIENGEGSFSLFAEVSAINQGLHDEAATVRLFASIHRQQPELAGHCYHVAEAVLVDHGEYAICINYVSDLEKRLEALGQMYEVTMRIASKYPPSDTSGDELREFAESRFVQEADRLIAIFESVGRTADADRVRAVARDHKKING